MNNQNENQEEIKLPSIESFIVKNRFFAGVHPCSRYCETEHLIAQLEKLAHFGITHFVDLTEEGEEQEYEHLLQPGQKYLRFPIKESSAPNSTSEVQNVYHAINEILEENSSNQVYLHSDSGLGRVGIIIGGMLADESDDNYPQLMQKLSDLLSVCQRLESCRIPRTAEQCTFLRNYIKERDARSQRPGIGNDINLNGVDIQHLMECFRDDQELYDSVLMYPHRVSLRNGRHCHRCGGQIIKMYYRSCDASWDRLAGRAGELIVCEKCHEWMDFRCFVMN